MIITTLFSLYFIFILTSIFGFLKKNDPRDKDFLKVNKSAFLTLIVPYRNEERRIQELLSSLEKQNDISCISKIIFINDHSSDSSKEIIDNWLFKQAYASKSLSLDEFSGKKRAIDLGLKYTYSDYVMVMDADISFNKSFLKNLNLNLNLDYDLYLTCVIEKNCIVWSKIISFSLSVISLGMAKLGFPILANGAGLIFKKETYNKLNPFESNFTISSGDDMYLLKIFNENNKLIKPLYNHDLIIKTQGPNNILEMINRSLRWSGKMRNSGLLLAKIFGFLVLLCNILIIPLSLSFLIDYQLYYLIPILLKLSADILVLIVGSAFYKDYFMIKYSLPMFLLYPFLLLAILFLQIINFKIKWKGRDVLIN